MDKKAPSAGTGRQERQYIADRRYKIQTMKRLTKMHLAKCTVIFNK